MSPDVPLIALSSTYVQDTVSLERKAALKLIQSKEFEESLNLWPEVLQKSVPECWLWIGMGNFYHHNIHPECNIAPADLHVIKEDLVFQ